MGNLVREIAFDKVKKDSLLDEQIYKEFLMTNGLGGYASTSLSGFPTRRYHGLLIASLPPPLGRIVLLNYIQDKIQIDDKSIYPLSLIERANEAVEPIHILKSFRLENGFPVWTYVCDGSIIEKSIFMPYHQNSVHINYRLIEGVKPSQLILSPFFNFRHYEDSVKMTYIENYEFTNQDNAFEINRTPYYLRLLVPKEAKFLKEPQTLPSLHYRVEAERGYDSLGDLFSPGSFFLSMEKEKLYTFIASTENWDVIKAISSEDSLNGEKKRRFLILERANELHPIFKKKNFCEELVIASDQFITAPLARTQDVIRAHSIGEEPRTIIAGYHWFTDWGRDTMISLEGLTLVTGRFKEAEYILQTFALHIKNGLIPNMFPDVEKEGVYYTCDATLWFFHALDRYYHYTKDESIIVQLLPKLEEIIEYHIKGTLFGIHVDPKDGLLTQGEKGYALTWMDAKVDNFVVTPRAGKAVEINALWYNALCLLSEWQEKFKTVDKNLKSLAQQCYESFNKKFWNEENQSLYDVIEGEKEIDASCRPNQLFAIGLKYPILKQEQWKPVLEIVKKYLVTPFGLRTLSPEDPNYKLAYSGNLFLRDSAYHQGTIWPWLFGIYVDSYMKVYPDHSDELKKIFANFEKHIDEGCIGTVNEIFDGNEPYNHRGCVAQAWSVSEILRSYVSINEITEHAEDIERS